MVWGGVAGPAPRCEMKKTCRLILIGLACGWLLAILLGRNVGPGSRVRMRLERVRHLVGEIAASTSVDEAEHKIRRANELMSTWKNPYVLELENSEEGLFLLAIPTHKAMYNLEPMQRILFLNFSSFEYPTMKERMRVRPLDSEEPVAEE